MHNRVVRFGSQISMYIQLFFSSRFRYLFAMSLNALSLMVTYGFWYQAGDIAQYGSKEQLLQYVILAQVLRTLVVYFRMTNDISVQVRSGKIITEFTKPYSLLENIFAQQVGRILIFIPTMSIPLCICSYLLNKDLLSLENDGISIIFILSVLLAICISTILGTIMGLISFWMPNISGISMLNMVLVNFFSGTIIPVQLLPSFIKNCAFLLPYRYIIDVPMNILIYRDKGGFAGQCFWLIVLILVYNLLIKKAVKKIEVVGG